MKFCVACSSALLLHTVSIGTSLELRKPPAGSPRRAVSFASNILAQSIGQVRPEFEKEWHAKGEKEFQKALANRPKIPCHIHQTWKTYHLSSEQQKSVNSWMKKNKGCNYTLYTDAAINAFTKRHFHDSIWRIWHDLEPVQKADAFRYMVVLHRGGYYADIDVDDVKPISSWGVPNDVALIAGYEISKEVPWFTRTEQLEQWFFAAAPGHPVLKNCINILLQKWERGVRRTVELTGPGTWTDAVNQFLREKTTVVPVPGQLDIPLHQALGPANAKIWVLAATEVAVGGYSVNYTGSELIHHHFNGSWKKKIPIHPGIKTWLRDLYRIGTKSGTRLPHLGYSR